MYAKTIRLITLIVVGIISIAGFSLFMKSWVAPAEEQIRFEVYEESRAKILGDIRHLNRLRLQYETSESISQKSSLRNMILNEYSTVHRERLEEFNPELKEWIEELQRDYVNESQSQ